MVTEEGLVGRVTDVTDSTARITLITDQSSSVSAVVLESGAAGVVKHGASSSSLILDRVEKDEMVEAATPSSPRAGRRSSSSRSSRAGSRSAPSSPSASRTSTCSSACRSRPFVDFDSLSMVIVMLEKPRAERRRTQSGNKANAGSSGRQQGQKKRP